MRSKNHPVQERLDARMGSTELLEMMTSVAVQNMPFKSRSYMKALPTILPPPMPMGRGDGGTRGLGGPSDMLHGA